MYRLFKNNLTIETESEMRKDELVAEGYKLLNEKILEAEETTETKEIAEVEEMPEEAKTEKSSRGSKGKKGDK